MVSLPCGRVVGELLRKERRLGHAMLADSWKSQGVVFYIAVKGFVTGVTPVEAMGEQVLVAAHRLTLVVSPLCVHVSLTQDHRTCKFNIYRLFAFYKTGNFAKYL